MQLPLAIALQPSRQLAGLLWLAHLAALLLLVFLVLPLWSKLVLSLGIAVSFYRSVRYLRALDISRFVLRRDGKIEIFRKVDADGTLCELAASAILGGLIILELRDGVLYRRVALLSDAANPDDMRRLRVWLNWRKPTAI